MPAYYKKESFEQSSALLRYPKDRIIALENAVIEPFVGWPA
jgi:hypothetical protein